MTSSWFFLSTLNYYARSTTHQILAPCSSLNWTVWRKRKDKFVTSVCVVFFQVCLLCRSQNFLKFFHLNGILSSYRSADWRTSSIHVPDSVFPAGVTHLSSTSRRFQTPEDHHSVYAVGVFTAVTVDVNACVQGMCSSSSWGSKGVSVFIICRPSRLVGRMDKELLIEDYRSPLTRAAVCVCSILHSFFWHVQNVTIPCRSQEILLFLSVIYTLSFHPFPPTILPSFLTSSCHLFLVLPLSLVVSKFIYNTFFLGILFSSILSTCPNQRNLFNLIVSYSGFFNHCINFVIGLYSPIIFFIVMYWA